MKCAERKGRLSHSHLSQILLYFAIQTPGHKKFVPLRLHGSACVAKKRKGGGGGGVKESENGMTALPGDLFHFIFPFLSPRNACRLQTSAV